MFLRNITPPVVPGISVEGLNTKIVQPWGYFQQGKENGSFFPPIDIDPDRWNKLYPYRLLVIDINTNAIVKESPTGVGGSTSSGSFDNISKAGVSLVVKGVSSIFNSIQTTLAPPQGGLIFTPMTQWAFPLPISPQQIQISTPFSITTIPTLTGIVEEHGGVRFKMINCSGTMGIAPYRKSIGENITGSLGGLFSGTISNVANIAAQANALVRGFTSTDGGVTAEDMQGGFAGTGYAQALLLDQFLEQYAEAKRNPAMAAWRLVFDIPKQNQSFIVTPVLFTWSQSIDSPGEIKYQFQLKAWKRIDLAGLNVPPISVLPNVTPSILQRVNRAITNARSTVAAVSSTIQAVNGDVRQVGNVIRNISLLVKEIAGIPATAADMSSNLVRDLKSALAAAAATIDGAFSSNSPAYVGSTVPIGQVSSFSSTALSSPYSTSPEGNLLAANQVVGGTYTSSEGLSIHSVAEGNLGQQAQNLQGNDPSNVVFSNPDLYPEFFESISVDNLVLTPNQRTQVNNYLASGSLITIQDLLEAKAYLINLASLLANYYGKGNETYAYIYKTPPANITSTPLTIEQFDSLDAFYELIQSINLLTATQQIDDGRIQSSLGYEAQVALTNGIPFVLGQSKVRAPVPFGLTIEQIAARYLGDPNRWVELAALNDLQEPYIDESGFIRLLLSNASGRLINVSSNENLYVGQSVVIMAQTVPSTTRKITQIEKIGPLNVLVTLDGNDNLDIYTTARQARMKAYLSGTVNSQMQIYIPSDIVAPNDLRTRPVPRFTGDDLVGLSKIDWLLDDGGDIALDAYGDFRLAGGLNNLIQALKLKFAQPFATNLMNPTFGAGISVGMNVSDIESRSLYSKIATSILADPRFGSIKRLQIDFVGNTLNINLAVTIANGSGVLPINFNISI